MNNNGAKAAHKAKAKAKNVLNMRPPRLICATPQHGNNCYFGHIFSNVAVKCDLNDITAKAKDGQKSQTEF